MDLTEQQINYFQTFGFLRFDKLFIDDVDTITQNFEYIWEQSGGGHGGQDHDYLQRSALAQFIDSNEYMSKLIDDERIVGIASSLLGEDFNYSGSDGNYYVGDTAWHSDGYVDKKYLSFKMAFYLDPCSANTGCLRVIPGSHKFGDKFGDGLYLAMKSSKDNRTEELWGLAGADVPAVALETVPGDLLLFDHRIKHSSFGGGARRRMFTMNMEQRYADGDIDQLKDSIADGARFWVNRAYGDVMINTADDSRMVHLEQRLSNDSHLAELSRKAREQMDEPSRS
mgnify:CR=1 FL=1|tara:strand:+ start:6296 stop:7144 length:849 start_codon:yes stop_codon:yes gene_type:complete